MNSVSLAKIVFFANKPLCIARNGANKIREGFRWAKKEVVLEWSRRYRSTWHHSLGNRHALDYRHSPKTREGDDINDPRIENC